MISKIYGNLSEYLSEHLISKMNHDHGYLLNSIRMKLVDILGQLEVLDSFIPIFKSFKSDYTLKFAYPLKSSNIFNTFMNARPELARKTSVEI